MIDALTFFDEVFDSLVENDRDWQRLATDDFFRGDASGHDLALSKLLNIAKDCNLLDDLSESEHISKYINKFLEVFPKIPKQ